MARQWQTGDGSGVARAPHVRVVFSRVAGIWMHGWMAGGAERASVSGGEWKNPSHPTRNLPSPSPLFAFGKRGVCISPPLSPVPSCCLRMWTVDVVCAAVRALRLASWSRGGEGAMGDLAVLASGWGEIARDATGQRGPGPILPCISACTWCLQHRAGGL